MTALAILGAALAALLVLVLLVGLSRPDAQPSSEYETTERSAMPDEIANARLVLSERRFTTNRPIPLVARVDQVFLVDGRLVPVETKTRFLREVFPYDRIELAVQAVVLTYARPPELQAYPVASYGYVRLVRPDGSVVYRRTDLPDEAQVLALAQRRLDLEQGRAAPRPPVSTRICRSCGQRSRCAQAAT